MRHRLLAPAFALAALLAPLVTEGPTAQQGADSDPAAGDGLVHAELTLESQPVSVAFAPDLAADHPAYRQLLSGTTGARVRVAELEAHRALRIGSLTPDLDSPPPEPEPDIDPDADEDEDAAPERPTRPRYAVWLARDAEGWELELHDGPAGDAPASTDAAGIVPLAHRGTEVASVTFTASLHALADETGRLVLRWGRHEWAADFQFEDLPRRPRPPRQSGSGTARERDTDTTAIARNNMLSERNETAMVLADGSRIGVLFWKDIATDGEDYGHFATTADDAVVRLIHAAVLRLRTDVPLRFGRTIVPTGNLAPGFAGVYGLWLKKVSDGWRLVFNDEPDSWGTQHDPSFDAAEIDVVYARGDGSFRPLAVTLVPTGADRGRLVVHWGPHEWATDFVVAE